MSKNFLELRFIYHTTAQMGMLTYDYQTTTKKLKKLGYSLLRKGKGSHRIWTNYQEYGEIAVPDHGSDPLSKGLLKAIINHTGLTNEAFDEI